MKPVLVLSRVIIVGLFWSIFFLEGIRIIMLQNWYFDIFNPEHWNIAWNLWLSGWIIDEPKEWAFILIILTFIPLWLTGWAALSLICWENIIGRLIIIPWQMIKKSFLKPVKIITNSSLKGVKKKKSYKEIRPRSIGVVLDNSYYAEDKSNKNPAAKPAAKTITPAAPKPLPQSPSLIEKETAIPAPAVFDHSLFQFDDDDDFEFNIDAFDDKPAEKPVPLRTEDTPARNNKKKDAGKTRENALPRQPRKDNANQSGSARQAAPAANNKKASPLESGKAPRVSNSTLEVIKQKGYEVITAATIRSTLVDFIAVSGNHINLCLIDKEPGDWLADEERFNDEEPLWFSESSHRISPVRKIDIARQALKAKLEEAGLEYTLSAFVIVQIGNIINAEDMFEIWDNMNISVTRIDRGSPKELKLFSKSLEDAESPIEKDEFEKLKKFVRSIA